MSTLREADLVLARSLVDRLNGLIVDPAIRRDVSALLRVRVECSPAAETHPTIQASRGLGFLGLLNGAVGVFKGGPRDGWGLVAALVDEHTGEVQRFALTHEVRPLPAPTGSG